MLKNTPGSFFPTSHCVIKIYLKFMFQRYRKSKSYHHELEVVTSHELYTVFDSLWPRRIDRDNPIVLNSRFPPHYLHICQCWKMHTNNLLLFSGVCLSILELLGFKYCKWIIYICTVYNFQVHEMDYQRLILVMKKKDNPSTLYIKSM